MGTIAHAAQHHEASSPLDAIELFTGLTLTGRESLARKRSSTLAASLTLHTVIVFLLIVVPLVFDDSVPMPQDAVRAFFVSPPDAAPPPPPPPPPPPAGPRAPVRKAAPPPTDPRRFVAPVEVPANVAPEEPTLDLGFEGGVPGGVEGGVPGGVIGGIVGGLPEPPPPPKETVVRVGGQVQAPKLVHRVNPVYPELALMARVRAVIIIDAVVGPDGRVRQATVLRGHPLFDEAAVAAVKQWIYQPLLLNGAPTPFALTVTVMFNLRDEPRP